MHKGWTEDTYIKQSFETEPDGVTQIERPPSGYFT